MIIKQTHSFKYEKKFALLPKAMIDGTTVWLKSYYKVSYYQNFTLFAWKTFFQTTDYSLIQDHIHGRILK